MRPKHSLNHNIKSVPLVLTGNTWGHRLPALETQVQESMHNPDSFEQIETVSVVPDEKGYNIVMQFRGENGFGAIRVGTAKARLIADDCGLDGVIIEN